MIQHRASNIGHPTSVIKHLTSSTKHQTSITQHQTSVTQHQTSVTQHRSSDIRDPASKINIFFKLLKKVQVRSTKNPFFALSFEYEDLGLKGQTAFWSYLPRKRIVFRKSDLRIGFLDNRFERWNAIACSVSSS